MVGREYNNSKDNSLYAATPPLEALRLLMGYAATVDDGGAKEITINDISGGYFHAPVRRSLFIELPAEDEEAQEGEVGRLNVFLLRHS